MAGEYKATFRDYDGEKSVATFPIVELTVLNVDAIVALLATLKTTLQAITIGVLAAETIIGILAPLLQSLPANPEAQREVRWDAQYQDSTTLKKYTVNFGTANLDILANNSSTVPPADGTYIDFKDAFEDLVVSQDGNAVVLLRVVQRGANL